MFRVCVWHGKVTRAKHAPEADNFIAETVLVCVCVFFQQHVLLFYQEAMQEPRLLMGAALTDRHTQNL